MRCLAPLVLFLSVLSCGSVSAGPLSDYLESRLIKHWFQSDTSPDAPATLYVALGTACGDAAFTELPFAGGYARVGVVANAVNWLGPTANNGTVANGVAIAFPTASADWGAVFVWGIFDASTGGNLLVCTPLATARTVTAGATPKFGVGSLSVQFDN